MPTRTRPALSLLLLALAAPLALPAQTGSCGVGNARNWCAGQDSPGVVGVAQAGDRFGAALAFGDFDGDGATDLAVGAPGESDGLAGNAGAVWAFYSSSLGLHLGGTQVFDQDDLSGGDGGTESDDQFGFALAAGDIDGDGYDDLAIGSPFEDLPDEDGVCGILSDCEAAGVVHAVFGSPSGLDTTRVAFFRNSISFEGQGTGHSLTIGNFDGDEDEELVVGMPGSMTAGDFSIDTSKVAILTLSEAGVLVPAGVSGADPALEEGAQWGFAVALGGLGPDGAPGYASGAPSATAEGSPAAGRVSVLDEDGAGLAELFQNDFGTAGNGASDAFGSALAVGDFDGDGFDDLASAAPFKNDGGATDSGRIYVAFGSSAGVNPAVFDILSLGDFPGTTAANGDRLGAAVAAGDFDGDGFDDLFLGSPGRGGDDRGFVFYLRGSAEGLSAGVDFVLSEPTLGGTAQANAGFGSVLAMGDLDGDGADELGIGVPDKNSGADDSGIVYVTRQFNPNWIFGDGFESAGLAIWSDSSG
jgi:hypothetical protein